MAGGIKAAASGAVVDGIDDLVGEFDMQQFGANLAGASHSQSAERQDAFEVGEQHLDLVALSAGGRTCQDNGYALHNHR